MKIELNQNETESALAAVETLIDRIGDFGENAKPLKLLSEKLSVHLREIKHVDEWGSHVSEVDGDYS